MLRGLRRLNRYEKRILDIVRDAGPLARIRQEGFSRKSENGFRFPIHVIEIGKTSAVKKRPVGIVAGVHGLETIGVRILLDFLQGVVSENLLPEVQKGDLGLVVLPIVNPGGIAMKRRSNPAGVDLMRNSGMEAEKAMPFFGGQKVSNHLPYFRGKGLEPESRALYRFVFEYFFMPKNTIMPVLDIHSGFGSIDNVWWPYAYSKRPCSETQLYQKMADYLKIRCGHSLLSYGPQSESYTTHGDLWDRFYDHYYNHHLNNPKWKSKFLPLTLEVGTWSELRQQPSRIFKKRAIFNPTSESKQDTISRYRPFLRDLMRTALVKPAKWQD